MEPKEARIKNGLSKKLGISENKDGKVVLINMESIIRYFFWTQPDVLHALLYCFYTTIKKIDPDCINL